MQIVASGAVFLNHDKSNTVRDFIRDRTKVVSVTRYALKLACRQGKNLDPGIFRISPSRSWTKGLGIGDFAERGETSEMAETITRPSGDTM